MQWISKIADTVNGMFKRIRKPAQAIPPVLLLCEIAQRPGLSAMALASAIIARLPEAGIDTSTNADGSQQAILSFVRILSEEVVREIKENSVVEIAIDPLAIPVTGTGANAGGPVQIIGYNSAITSHRGLVR